jgi:glycosyltransferase involved in cell wall biosynthesis
MNIAVIGVGILPTHDSNGIPAFHAALRELAKAHTVTVYSFIPVLDDDQIRQRSVPFKRLPQKLQYLYLGFLFLMDHFFNRVEVIHAQSPFPAGVLARKLSKITRVPWLLSFHAGEAANMPEVPYGDLLIPFLKKINSAITQKAPMVIAMSQHQARMIQENLGYPGEVICLPRGMVVPLLKEKKRNEIPSFLHASYYQPVKDPLFILEVMKELSFLTDFQLVIAGANYPENFREKIRALRLENNIRFVGSVSHEEVLTMLGNVDFLIHTSHCEGLPMVALEAMSRGAVVCGTSVGIMADLSPGHCITTNNRDPNALALAIIDCWNNPLKYSSIRMKAWQWVSEHDMDWYIKQLTTCYHKAISLK